MYGGDQASGGAQNYQDFGGSGYSDFGKADFSI